MLLYEAKNSQSPFCLKAASYIFLLTTVNTIAYNFNCILEVSLLDVVKEFEDEDESWSSLPRANLELFSFTQHHSISIDYEVYNNRLVQT